MQRRNADDIKACTLQPCGRASYSGDHHRAYLRVAGNDRFCDEHIASQVTEPVSVMREENDCICHSSSVRQAFGQMEVDLGATTIGPRCARRSVVCEPPPLPLPLLPLPLPLLPLPLPLPLLSISDRVSKADGVVSSGVVSGAAELSGVEASGPLLPVLDLTATLLARRALLAGALLAGTVLAGAALPVRALSGPLSPAASLTLVLVEVSTVSVELLVGSVSAGGGVASMVATGSGIHNACARSGVGLNKMFCTIVAEMVKAPTVAPLRRILRAALLALDLGVPKMSRTVYRCVRVVAKARAMTISSDARSEEVKSADGCVT